MVHVHILQEIWQIIVPLSVETCKLKCAEEIHGAQNAQSNSCLTHLENQLLSLIWRNWLIDNSMFTLLC